ncbi:hypothetical protein ACFVWG_22405 [Kribbella sp. NPDC058245]|uniref:hypothetical protein n=1 Tax=Kribbella sp. NPDC058245 TaxID=3346399 RepID=UPI0036E2CC24
MNLTSPPPVEQLDPEYAETLRRNAVRGAYKAFRPRPPRWVPVAAAACGVAVIATGVVALSRGGGGTVEPEPASTPAPAKIVEVPANASKVVSNDLGAASESDARAAARKCLTPVEDAYGHTMDLFKPEDADTAKIQSARWVKDPGMPANGKSLLQSLDTRDSGLTFHCLGDLMIWWGPTASPYHEKEPVAGTWSRSDAGPGPEITSLADYRFRAADNVDRVQLRIRGVAGASPWYSIKVIHNLGYLKGELPGTPITKYGLKLDLRAFDKSGKQVWSKTGDA